MRAHDAPHRSHSGPQVLLHDIADLLGLAIDRREDGLATDQLSASWTRMIGCGLDRLLQREVTTGRADKGERNEEERQSDKRPEYDLQEGPHGSIEKPAGGPAACGGAARNIPIGWACSRHQPRPESCACFAPDRDARGCPVFRGRGRKSQAQHVKRRPIAQCEVSRTYSAWAAPTACLSSAAR